MDPILDTLTPAQREAVEHCSGPLLILAGPGSGKTRVVTHRIAHLLHQGVSAREILALTFTNKAADEMRARVEALEPGAPVWMSTFHRFCSRLLREHAPLVGLKEHFSIYDTQDSRQVLRRVLEDLHWGKLPVTTDQIATRISRAKNDLVTAHAYQPLNSGPLEHIVSEVYPLYQARLLVSSAVDFDDLLLHVATLLADHPLVRTALDQRYRYILVDEYQDTNRAQYVILRALSVAFPNLAVTGDPDQSIFGWRGANLSNILDFEGDYPQARVVRLEHNWRSTRRILRVADALISHNQMRKQKALTTQNAEGPAVRLVAYATQMDESQGIAGRIRDQIHTEKRRPRDFGIFYRVNALSRTFEAALHDQGIPCQLVHSVEFFQRKEIKDVLAYLQLIANPRDDAALLRIINTPPRGIGKRTIQRVQEYAASRGMSLLEAARNRQLISDLPKRGAVPLEGLVNLLDQLAQLAFTPVEEILRRAIAQSGYRQHLEASKSEEDTNRLENVEELITAAQQFDEEYGGCGDLEEYLERVCLVGDTDGWDEQGDKVTLMSLHAAKGLEFPVVYIVAVEDGILPHERNRQDPAGLEEERRLLFVGMTRAREELQLSYAVHREFRGQRRSTIPSSFLMELPRHEMELADATGPVEAQAVAAPSHHPQARPHAQHRSATASIITAAQLAGVKSSGSTHVSPDDFYPGMAVTHPEYGPGKIIALDGDGSRRRATVAFPVAGERRFVLAASPLQPVRSKGSAQELLEQIWPPNVSS